MTILEQIEQRSSALKVNELAEMLQVTPQHIYRMASSGLIPCFRIEGAIRLDPKEIVNWLRSKQPQAVRTRRLRAALTAGFSWESLLTLTQRRPDFEEQRRPVLPSHSC